MTQQEMSEVMSNVFDQCMKMRAAGQQEYARDTANAFANFEWIAAQVSKGLTDPITREQVLLIYALKHLDGIMSDVNGHRSQRENVRGRIYDLIVYLTLLHGMIDERDGGGVPRWGKLCDSSST